MADVLFFFILLMLFAICGCLFFKYRATLRRWLKDPKYGSSWCPSRETVLKRKIEDAEAELDWLKEKKTDNEMPETED